jgi:hypothetical protein
MVPVAAAVAMVLTGCGGAAPGSSTSGAHSVPARIVSVARSRPTQIYRLPLTGAAEPGRGAPHGRGAAIIAFHGPSVVCWRFAHLHGFVDATYAHINAGSSRGTGSIVIPLMPGPRLHHEGCVSVNPATSETITRNPSHFYVNVFSRAYPGGAVRGQL